MECSPCAHEQQNRHLKSRVSQLEIMLEKERKRTTATSQATAAHNWIPREVPPVNVMKSQEYMALLAVLESERRIKVDLMANLKEMKSANDSSRALLLQELDDAKSSRDTLIAELEELQDEFDVMRGMFKSHLTASALKTFAVSIDKSHENRIRTLLLSIAKQLPRDLMGDLDPLENNEMEQGIQRCILDMIDLKISPHNVEGLRCLIESCGKAPTANTADEASALAADLGIKRLHELDLQNEVLRSTIDKAVPSIFKDLFALLNKATSFEYPSEFEVFDEAAQLVYSSYLNTACTNLSHTIRKYITSHARSRQKLSYRTFNAGDLALFLPTRNANSPAWAAFNVGAPHYFLHMQGVDTQGKDFLIGRIQEISEKGGEPGVSPSTSLEAENSSETRKWWEVKILEKKKVGQTEGL